MDIKKMAEAILELSFTDLQALSDELATSVDWTEAVEETYPLEERIGEVGPKVLAEAFSTILPVGDTLSNEVRQYWFEFFTTLPEAERKSFIHIAAFCRVIGNFK